MYKKLYITGIVAYVFLIGLAVLFYKERTVFIDVAYLLFNILKEQDFAIQANRYGVVFTQAIPLLSGRLGLSLDSVCLLYSAGVMGYYFICYLVCGSVLKNYRMALVLLLFNLLFFADAFYWMQAELQQGLGFMIVVLSLIDKQQKDGVRAILSNIILLAAIVTAVFFHPLIFMPLTFVLCFFYLGKAEVSKRKLVFVFIIILLTVVIKNKFFQPGYDKGAIDSSRHMLWKVKTFFSLTSTERFASNCLTKFYWIPVLSIWIAGWYCLKRKFLKLLLFLGSMCGYIVLINISYSTPDVAPFYIENLYLVMSVFMAVPLVYDILPEIRKPAYAYALVGVIVATGLIRIYMSHEPYTKRLNWLQAYLDENKDKKLIVADAKAPMDLLIMTWGTPYEFWILSTTKYNSTASLMFSDNINAYFNGEYYFNRKDFVTAIQKESYNDLKPPYFQMKDTATGYTVIK